jgi:hypothetical protein
MSIPPDVHRYTNNHLLILHSTLFRRIFMLGCRLAAQDADVQGMDLRPGLSPIVNRDD